MKKAQRVFTSGKEYEVKKAAKGFFHIVNDTGATLAYDKVRFKVDKKAASPDSKNSPVPIKVFNIYWYYNGDEVKKTSFTLRDGSNVNKELRLLLKNDWFDFGRDGDSLKIELVRDVKTSSGDSQ